MINFKIFFPQYNFVAFLSYLKMPNYKMYNNCFLKTKYLRKYRRKAYISQKRVGIRNPLIKINNKKK